MTVELRHILFAENVIRGENDSLSLINIFEGIKANVPTVQNALFVIASFNLTDFSDDAVFAVNVNIFDPSGQLMNKIDMGEFTKARTDEEFHVNMVIQASGMPLNTLGDYRFEFVDGDGNTIASRLLPVRQAGGDNE